VALLAQGGRHDHAGLRRRQVVQVRGPALAVGGVEEDFRLP
jgi:hypothetical protein